MTVPYDNQCICLHMEAVSCNINFSPLPTRTKHAHSIPSVEQILRGCRPLGHILMSYSRLCRLDAIFEIWNELGRDPTMLVQNANAKMKSVYTFCCNYQRKTDFFHYSKWYHQKLIFKQKKESDSKVPSQRDCSFEHPKCKIMVANMATTFTIFLNSRNRIISL